MYRIFAINQRALQDPISILQLFLLPLAISVDVRTLPGYYIQFGRLWRNRCDVGPFAKNNVAQKSHLSMYFSVFVNLTDAMEPQIGHLTYLKGDG